MKHNDRFPQKLIPKPCLFVYGCPSLQGKATLVATGHKNSRGCNAKQTGHPFPEPKRLRRWRAGKSSELHRSGSFVPIRQAGTIPDHEPDVLTIAGFGDCKSNIPASTGRFQESADGVLLHQQADVREDGGILKKYQLWNRKIYFVFIYWVYAILKVLDYWNPFGVAGLTGWLVSAVQAPESGP